MRRWFQTHHRARNLAVSLLILALLPTPLPKVEFHNVRHHDEAGQVCEYHDHLLRWHPDAAAGADVAVLHWHWGWPVPDPTDDGHTGTIPRLHAYLAEEALPTAESAPAIVPDGMARSFVPVAAPLLAAMLVDDSCVHDYRLSQPGIPRALTFGATFAPRTSLTTRLHRWSC